MKLLMFDHFLIYKNRISMIQINNINKRCPVGCLPFGIIGGCWPGSTLGSREVAGQCLLCRGSVRLAAARAPA